MAATEPKPLRMLFLCTHNSARSQIAEALLQRKGRGKFVAASAGTEPASSVHPLAVRLLGDAGIDWSAKRPKSIDAVQGQSWDLIITVCDRAKEKCPAMPGQPIYAHWGIEDPAAVEGSDEERYQAFHEALTYLSRRLDLMLAIPFEKMERRAIEERMKTTE